MLANNDWTIHFSTIHNAQIISLNCTQLKDQPADKSRQVFIGWNECVCGIPFTPHQTYWINTFDALFGRFLETVCRFINSYLLWAVWITCTHTWTAEHCLLLSTAQPKDNSTLRAIEVCSWTNSNVNFFSLFSNIYCFLHFVWSSIIIIINQMSFERIFFNYCLLTLLFGMNRYFRHAVSSKIRLNKWPTRKKGRGRNDWDYVLYGDKTHKTQEMCKKLFFVIARSA